jgi:hypothetical protein
MVVSAAKYEHLAYDIEEAMRAAILQCLASGVSLNDSATIRKAMLDARQRVLRSQNVASSMG